MNQGVEAESISSLVGLMESLQLSSIVDSADNESLLRLVRVCADNRSLLILIQQQAAELDALKRITRNLTSSLELKDVLDALLREALNLVKDARSAQIYLSHGQNMVFSAAMNSDGSLEPGIKDPCFDGVIDEVVRTRKLFIVEDMSVHPIFWKDDDCRGALIGLPLNMGDRLAGIMYLSRAQPGEFTRSEIRLLTLLADQASIAIINARLHQAVSQQARVDVLTSLPNRLGLEERLEEQIQLSKLKTKTFTVVMLDLDGFKVVNDTHGHDSGDEILHRIGHFLQENLRSSDFVARYGGDEFALVLPDTDLAQAKIVVEKIIHCLEKLEIQVTPEKNIKMAISAGIAIHPDHALTSPGLLRAADEALYHAKRNSPGGYQVAVKPDA